MAMYNLMMLNSKPAVSIDGEYQLTEQDIKSAKSVEIYSDLAFDMLINYSADDEWMEKLNKDGSYNFKTPLADINHVIEYMEAQRDEENLDAIKSIITDSINLAKESMNNQDAILILTAEREGNK